MGKPITRTPVRITIWPDERTRIDVRGWLDEFNVLNDPVLSAFESGSTVFQSGTHTFRVIAHNNHRDKPWKFNRGKPAV